MSPSVDWKEREREGSPRSKSRINELLSKYYPNNTLLQRATKIPEQAIRYSAMSGIDITATFVDPINNSVMTVGSILTLTVSTYREVAPVRACGSTAVRGYTRGARTVAGSMIFTSIYRPVLEVMCENLQSIDNSAIDMTGASTPRFLIDQLPPFDVHISIVGEFGVHKRRSVFGVRLISEGVTYSVEDILVENTFSYIAHGVTPEVSVHSPNTIGEAIPDTVKGGFGSLAEKYASEIKARNPFR